MSVSGIHRNQALFAAIRKGQRRALHGGELRTDKIVPKVEKVCSLSVSLVSPIWITGTVEAE